MPRWLLPVLPRPRAGQRQRLPQIGGVMLCLLPVDGELIQTQPGPQLSRILKGSDRRVAHVEPLSSPAEKQTSYDVQRVHMSVDFLEDDGVYTSAGNLGRRWRITRAFTGWRLEFIDPGDTAMTNAGVHATVAAAQAEANTPSTTGGRRQRP